MSNNERRFRTNFDSIPEHTKKVTSCYVGVSPHPASYCSACQEISRSIPLAIYDFYGELLCDSCAEGLKVPALTVKRSYDQSLQVFEGYYEVSFDISYYWRVAIKKKETLRMHFGTRALVETLCDRSAAFGVSESYIVCMKDTPVYMELTNECGSRALADEVFEKAHTELIRLIEGSQNEENHIEYFYLIDQMYYPPGLIPGKRDDFEQNFPSWKWPL